MQTPTLTTSRLILRPIALSDAPAIQQKINDWDILQYLSAAIPWPYPDDGALWYLQNSLLPRIDKGDAHAWAITLKGDDTAQGVIEFRVVPNDDGHRGFWLAKEHWGRGYMREATAAINDFVFDRLGFDEFIECNAVDNKGSHALKKHYGAELLEIHDAPAIAGQIQPSEVWRVTRTGWQAAKNKSS